MGKTKIKTIDDSQMEPEIKKKKSSGGRLPPNTASSRPREAGRTRGEAKSDLAEPQGVSTEGAVSEQASGAADRSVKSDESPTQKKPQKPGKVKPRSKKYQEVTKDLDRTKSYSTPEAVDMVKKLSYAKFNATLEAHINTTQTGIRGLVPLPYATGKKIRILAFGPSSGSGQANELETMGAVVGDDKAIDEIAKGKIDFDIIVVTPAWMPKIAKVAKILGPRGLMPNPKNNTITDDLKKTVAGFQAGKTEYKTEPKAPIIHLGLGKLNQPTEELSTNVKTLLQTLGKSRVKKVFLSSTMGPSVKVDLTSI